MVPLMNENKNRDATLKDINKALTLLNRTLAETNKTLKKVGDDLAKGLTKLNERTNDGGSGDSSICTDKGRPEPGDQYGDGPYVGEQTDD